MTAKNVFRRMAVRHPKLAVMLRPVVVPVVVRTFAGLARARTLLGKAKFRLFTYPWHVAQTQKLKMRNRVDQLLLAKDRMDARIFAKLNEAGRPSAISAYSALIRPRLFPMLQAAAGPRSPITDPNGLNDRAVMMLVVSDLRIDPRVEREARSLAQAGYAVHIVCPDFTIGAADQLRIDWGPQVFIRLIDWKALQFVMCRPGFLARELFDGALEIAREVRPFAIHAHDLNACLAGLAVAKSIGAHFVADFHEWTSENVHWSNQTGRNEPYPEDWKAELQALEAQVMREASCVITVCDSIADALAKELGNGRKVEVIRNIPVLSAQPTKDYPPLKQQLGLAENQFLLLWQGGTGPTRLIEPIIAALEFAPACVFAIRGPSLDMFGKDYRAVAEKAGAGDRLILLDPVPSRDVVAAACGADAGVWTLPRLCRNFTYALPNKIFEYTASNLALLVAEYPEARRMVETHAIGLTFDPYDPRSIASAINRLIDEPGLASGFRQNTHTALKTLDATGEWQRLVAIYNALPRAHAAKSSA